MAPSFINSLPSFLCLSYSSHFHTCPIPLFHQKRKSKNSHFLITTCVLQSNPQSCHTLPTRRQCLHLLLITSLSLPTTLSDFLAVPALHAKTTEGTNPSPNKTPPSTPQPPQPPPPPPPENETDESVGYTFRPPAGWIRNVGTLSGGRSLIVYTPPPSQTSSSSINITDTDTDMSVTAVATPISSEFRKLGSFGTVDNVVNTLVPKKSGGSVVKVKTDQGKNAYIVEYKLQKSKGRKDGEEREWMRLVTVFGLVPGKYIVGVTAQAREDQWKDVEDVLRNSVESYQLLK